MQARDHQAFTLIEVLIAAAVVMILAGIAVVTFASTEEDALEAACVQSLQRLRTGIDYYMFQHQEQTPGYDSGTATWTSAAFVGQLTQATNDAGGWAAPGTAGYVYGPYLLDGIPNNPYSDLETILIIPPAGAFAGPDDSTGWVYFGSTGIIRANSTGTASSGKNIYEL